MTILTEVMVLTGFSLMCFALMTLAEDFAMPISTESLDYTEQTTSVDSLTDKNVDTEKFTAKSGKTHTTKYKDLMTLEPPRVTAEYGLEGTQERFQNVGVEGNTADFEPEVIQVWNQTSAVADDDTTQSSSETIQAWRHNASTTDNQNGLLPKSANASTIGNNTEVRYLNAADNPNKLVPKTDEVRHSNVTGVDDNASKLASEITHIRRQNVTGEDYNTGKSGPKTPPKERQNAARTYLNTSESLSETIQIRPQNLTGAQHNKNDSLLREIQTWHKNLTEADDKKTKLMPTPLQDQIMVETNTNASDSVLESIQVRRQNSTRADDNKFRSAAKDLWHYSGTDAYDTTISASEIVHLRRESVTGTDDDTTDSVPKAMQLSHQNLVAKDDDISSPVPKEIQLWSQHVAGIDDDITESVPEAIQIWLQNVAETEEENEDWNGYTIWDDYNLVDDSFQNNLEQESSVIAALLEGNSGKSLL